MRNRLLFTIGLLVTLLGCGPVQPATLSHTDELPRKIAFVSERDGNCEVCLMNSDGSEQICLTDNAADDTNPVWSPDGGKIAFQSNRDGGNEIYIMNADGSEQTRVTHTDFTNYFFGSYDWSPDGKKLIFGLLRVTADSSSHTVYSVNVDGQNLMPLTDPQKTNHAPSLSPDGNLIAFLYDVPGDAG